MIPKYRMWNRITSKLHHVDGLYFDSKTVQYIDEVGILRFIKFENTILMQSTGLHDKNGKEIFEFDVVSMPQFGDLKPWVGVVKRMEGKWVVDTGKLSLTLWSEIEETDILGNMFENPELLEVE